MMGPTSLPTRPDRRRSALQPAPASGPSPATALAVGAAPRARRRQLNLRTVAWSALGGLIVTAVVVVVCSRNTPLLSPASVRPLPPSLAGPLSGLGPDIRLGGVIAVFTVMCACYYAIVRLGAMLPLRAIVISILALHLLFALAPPLLSTDVFSYGAYGRMGALYGLNPYLVGPYPAIRADAWYPFIDARWVLTPTAYGPLFTAISYLLARLTLGAGALAYKLIAVTFSLGAIGAVARAANRLGYDRHFALTVMGLNPVLLIYAVGGAHNDLIMLAALAWSIVALVGRRTQVSGGLIVTAAAVKLTGAILLPFAMAARRDRTGGRCFGVMVGAGATLAIVIVLSAVLFGAAPLHLLGTLETIQGGGGSQSVPGFLAGALGLAPPGRIVQALLDGGVIAAVLGLLGAVRSGRLDWLTAAGWAVVALLVTSSFLLPWYTIWLLPFAALSSSRWLRATALALTAIGLTSL